MRIGYPCINRSIGCKSDSTFRLKNYSEKRLISTVESNLDCLHRIIRFNKANSLLFFRITSDIIPFASHPICNFPWQNYFKGTFKDIGRFVRRNGARISMHPDQFIVLNTKKLDVLENSLRELQYHADLLDAMGLDETHKIQIHVGGVYGEKENSLNRFIERYQDLEISIQKRLVIENDHRSFTLGDCMAISGEVGIPVLFDVFHHKLKSSGEDLSEAIELVQDTWKKKDGIPMVDYSSQHPKKTLQSHAEEIDIADFKNFILRSRPYDIDIMLEIKDKEKSALKALKVVKKEDRFIS
jgi:UV DNA damage endonuclease